MNARTNPAPRPQLYTPSSLSLYQGCPERYRLAKVERQRVIEPFSPALGRGKTIHGVLAECLETARDRGVLPTDLANRVQEAHPRQGYADTPTWEADAATITAQVTYGLSHLTPGVRIIGVEVFHRWTFLGDALTPSFILSARADLILAGVDAEGQHYLEVIDWKSGAGRGVDLLQEVALRIVTRHALGREAEYIINTTIFVEQERSYAIVRDDVTCRDVWRQIKGIVGAIERDRIFPPLPNARCPYCPYFGNGCLLDRPQPAGADETAAWLEANGE